MITVPLETLRALLVEVMAVLGEDEDDAGEEGIDRLLRPRGLDPDEVLGPLGFEVSSAALVQQQEQGASPQVALAGTFIVGLALGLRVADERAALELRAQLAEEGR